MKLLRLFLLVLSASALASPSQLIEPRVTLEVNEGFCPTGAVVPLVPEAGDPPKLNIWGGYCYVEQTKPQAAKTSLFTAPRFLRIYLTGYSQSPTLAIVREADGAKFFLEPWDPSLFHWGSYDYELPSDWQGKPVRLVAADTGVKGMWRAFSEPLAGSGSAPMGDAARILARTSLHFFAIMVCALAFTAMAVQRGVRSLVHAGAIFLAGTAAPGYCIFWITLLSPTLARYLAVTVMVASIVGLVFIYRKLDGDGRGLLKSLLTPILLTGAVALMVGSAGFLYGGMRHPLDAAARRYSHPLPADNEIPFLFAQGARAKHVPRPLMSDWLSSDRPPLQAGIVVEQFPLISKPRDLSYMFVGVVLQSLWIFALWLLLTAFRLNPRLIALALAASLFSGFVFLNSFYVWPKLLATTYSLAFLAAWFGPKPKDHSWLTAWIVPGALLCFSFLSHGGAIFALVPMVPIMVLMRLAETKRMIAIGLFAFALYIPWTLYQKLYDPPGDRLMKTHLAGVEQYDNRSFLQTAITSYGLLTWKQIAYNKITNLELAFGRGFMDLRSQGVLLGNLLSPDGLGKAAQLGSQLRGEAFFYIAPCLGLFIFGPYALCAGILKRFRTLEWRTACLLWILNLAGIVFWSLLIFGPAKTLVPSGPYSMIIMAQAAAVLAFWAVSPRLAVVLTFVQIVVNFIIYGPLIRVAWPNSVLPEGILHGDTLALLIVSFVAVLVLLTKLSTVKASS